jgi:hypothetical protein
MHWRLFLAGTGLAIYGVGFVKLFSPSAVYASQPTKMKILGFLFGGVALATIAALWPH